MTDLSIDARLLAPHNDRHSANTAVVTVAAAALIVGAAALGTAISWRQGLLLLGGALGLTLYHALFGFTSAWRVFIVAGRGAGLHAQMVMLAIAVVLFFPALAHGTLFGTSVHGEYGAVGVGMLTGAFLFGLGMQLVVVVELIVSTCPMSSPAHAGMTSKAEYSAPRHCGAEPIFRRRHSGMRRRRRPGIHNP